MKHLLLAISIIAASCSEAPQSSANQLPVTVNKIVKSKKESTETKFKYKYNVWKGNFYHVPDVHTVYYLIYTDGTFEQVSVGEYMTTEAGETKTTYIHPKF